MRFYLTHWKVHHVGAIVSVKPTDVTLQLGVTLSWYMPVGISRRVVPAREGAVDTATVGRNHLNAKPNGVRRGIKAGL